MTFVILFMFTGAVAARYLQKKNYRVALACHSVAFTVALVYISFMPGLSAGSWLWSRVLGAQNAKEVSDLLYGVSAGGTAAVAVICALASLTALQTAFLAFSAAQRLGAIVLKLAKSHETASAAGTARRAPAPDRGFVFAERRYITLCALLC